ncbi:uncharacterized protein LOC142340666 [Convolutriloba macropyga]|uniref:uncharacterized protein LOC142340666 n=1 Tax=Convolutriloba macropyga TaxID=536237 RepID=UPI003F51E248
MMTSHSKHKDSPHHAPHPHDHHPHCAHHLDNHHNGHHPHNAHLLDNHHNGPHPHNAHLLDNHQDDHHHHNQQIKAAQLKCSHVLKLAELELTSSLANAISRRKDDDNNSWLGDQTGK